MNVLVTGVSRGIGLEVLKSFCSQSHINRVYAVSSTVCSFKNEKVVYIRCDFLKENWIEKIKSVVRNEEINILINNAGYLYQGSVKDTSSTEMNNMVQINYLAPIQIVQSLLSNLKIGKAHIVNIGSMGGFSGSSKFPGLSVYSSTKAALANLSECWAEELKEFGVTSNCLALGAVNTEMLKNAFPNYEAPTSSTLMGEKIVDFSINFNSVLNGKIIPFSVSTP
ncbi:MAG: SDR family NAD(P)-dependent oxidoreductase [Flavobacteriales bacterium]|nr:SDR family NAD(P)-dependent oxidoreductase [Flavobacteriales bacterium]